MASSAEVLLSFLFILVLFPSSQVQARESQFFSKVTRNSSPKEAAKEPSSEYPDAPVSEPTPAPAPGPASELFQPDNEDGHGLYGRGSNEFSPTTTTTTTVGENEFVPEGLAGESSEELEETSYSNNNNGDSTKYYNYNGYTTEKQGMSDTRFLENGKYYYNTNGYSNKYNNGYSNKYNNGYSTTSNYNGDSTEKQGMSDTRFLAHGKYYYDVKNQNNYVDGYNTEKGNTYKEGYYSNTQNSNEFNNSMEEYQGQQEYQEGQEEYVP